MEAFAVQIGRHEGAVGETRFDVELVQDAIEVGGVAGLLGGFLAVGKPFGVLGLEVVVRIAKQSFGRGRELRIVVAQAENVAFLRGSGHGVHVRVIGIARMGVIVVNGNGVDLHQKVFVKLGQVGGGIRSGLRGCREGEAQGQRQNCQQMKQTFHFGTPRRMTVHFSERF